MLYSWIFRFFAFCIVVADVFAQKRLDEGDACRLRAGTKGICVDYDECRSAQEEYQNQKLFPLMCRFKTKNNRPRVRIVCCDQQSAIGASTVRTTTFRTTTRRVTTRKPVFIPTTTVKPKTFIAAKKCEEYSKWLAPHKTFFEEELEPSAGECGVDSESFIWGGTETKPLEFPHMARLGFGEEGDKIELLSWECGGTLISEKFVLTAAHCASNRAGVPVSTVRLGHGDSKSSRVIKVIRRILHPGFKPPERYNDIALLELQESVVFSDYLRPACLQTEKSINSNRGVATGWGVTEEKKVSTKLLKVELPFLSHQNCSEIYTSNRLLKLGIIDDTMLCAGQLNVQKDTCQGDSGGPLQIALRIPACMYAIVGVTSFGIKCGVAPGVYTRVSAFVPWIESVVWS